MLDSEYQVHPYPSILPLRRAPQQFSSFFFSSQAAGGETGSSRTEGLWLKLAWLGGARNRGLSVCIYTARLRKPPCGEKTMHSQRLRFRTHKGVNALQLHTGCMSIRLKRANMCVPFRAAAWSWLSRPSVPAGEVRRRTRRRARCTEYGRLGASSLILSTLWTRTHNSETCVMCPAIRARRRSTQVAGLVLLAPHLGPLLVPGGLARVSK